MRRLHVLPDDCRTPAFAARLLPHATFAPHLALQGSQLARHRYAPFHHFTIAHSALNTALSPTPSRAAARRSRLQCTVCERHTPQRPARRASRDACRLAHYLP